MDNTPLKVLYIDDDAGLRRLVSKRLSRIGYDVSTSENGNDGIVKCNGEKFDIILVDQNMPDISGLEVIRKIPHILEHTPVIMMTGAGDETLAVDVLKSGASDYVIKDTSGNFLDKIASNITNVIEKQNLINEKRRIEKELQENLNLNKAILDALSASIAILDSEGNIVNVNKQWIDFGVSNDMPHDYDCVGINYFDICENADGFSCGYRADEAAKGISSVINGKNEDFNMVYECSSPQTQRWFEMRVTKVANLTPAKVVVSHENITTLKSSELKLKALSETDGLTGIANRRVFDDSLNREVSRAVRNKSEISMLMIDIDFFKAYNDFYGHLQGDECIKTVARVMKETISRTTDILARYGGEEFAVLLPDTNIDGAVHIGEQIIENLRKEALPHENSSVSGHVTLSVGVSSMSPEKNLTCSQLVDIADNALYKAKHEGRNRLCVL